MTEQLGRVNWGGEPNIFKEVYLYNDVIVTNQGISYKIKRVYSFQKVIVDEFHLQTLFNVYILIFVEASKSIIF